MRRLGRNGTKLLWIVHVTLAAVWLGSGVGMLALASSAAAGASPEAALGAWSSIATLDQGVAALAAMSTLLVGVVYGFLTPWGFLRTRWVAAKWLVSVAVIVSGVTIVHRATLAAIATLRGGGSVAATAGDASRVIACLAAQVAALVLAVVLSRLKPWQAARRVRAERTD